MLNHAHEVEQIGISKDQLSEVAIEYSWSYATTGQTCTRIGTCAGAGILFFFFFLNLLNQLSAFGLASSQIYDTSIAASRWRIIDQVSTITSLPSLGQSSKIGSKFTAYQFQPAFGSSKSSKRYIKTLPDISIRDTTICQVFFFFMWDSRSPCNGLYLYIHTHSNTSLSRWSWLS